MPRKLWNMAQIKISTEFSCVVYFCYWRRGLRRLWPLWKLERFSVLLGYFSQVFLVLFSRVEPSLWHVVGVREETIQPNIFSATWSKCTIMRYWTRVYCRDSISSSFNFDLVVVKSFDICSEKLLNWVARSKWAFPSPLLDTFLDVILK